MTRIATKKNIWRFGEQSWCLSRTIMTIDTFENSRDQIVSRFVTKKPILAIFVFRNVTQGQLPTCKNVTNRVFCCWHESRFFAFVKNAHTGQITVPNLLICICQSGNIYLYNLYDMYDLHDLTRAAGSACTTPLSSRGTHCCSRLTTTRTVGVT